MKFLGDERINPISGQSYRLLSPKPKAQRSKFGMARAFPQPHLPDPSSSPISAWQRQGTGDGVRREQAGSFPSIWPSQSSRRASPALSTRPEPTLLQDAAASRPGSHQTLSPVTPRAPVRITCGGFGQYRTVAPPQWGRGMGLCPIPDPGRAKRPTASLLPASRAWPPQRSLKGV